MTSNNQTFIANSDISNRVLVLFAHPALHYSKVNVQLIKAYEDLDNVTFHDLYEVYPRFFIDQSYEQKLLTEHDIIVFHYPLHWYNLPPLLKHWLDIVLTTSFVFGDNGQYALMGKKLLNVITTGGSKESYSSTGKNKYDLLDYLISIKQLAKISRMQFLPPFVLHDTRAMDNINTIQKHASLLRLTIQSLKRYNEEDFIQLGKNKYINDDLSVFIEDIKG